MAEQLNTILDLLIEEEGFSERQEELVRIFQSAITALSGDPGHPATLDGEAECAASAVRALIPPEMFVGAEEESSEKRQQLLGHFEEIWHALLDIATRIPHHDDQAQTVIVKTLQILKEDGSSPWKDLPNLGNIMRDKWIDPTFEWHPDEDTDGDDDNYTLSQWLNLNSFVARLFASGVIAYENFPLWQLRKGLEDDDLAAEAKGAAACCCSSAEAADNNRVAVACEWIIRAGPALLRLCLLDRQDLDEALRGSARVGDLFRGGCPGFNLERWVFWKKRLEELRSTVGAGVVSSVEEAIESMRTSAVVLVGN